MTNAEYRAHPAISRSDLFKLSKSPLHFRFEMDNPQEKTPALIFGSAFHKWVLEREDFYKEFAVAPKVDRRTKEGRLAWEEFQMEAAGKDVISEDDFETIKAMSESIESNRYVQALLSGKREQSFFWTDDLTGEECKCRTDILADIGDIHIIADVKSCTSADTETFSRDLVKYGYDLQTYMYTEGVRQNTGKDYTFVFIAVEKTAPYAVNIMQADQYVLMRGEQLFRELIGIYHDCKESGKWWGLNGFSGMINNLSLPAYLRKEYE